MRKCIAYIHDGAPRLTWPAVTVDPETDEEYSNLDALIAALPPGTDYALINPEEAEIWWRDNQPAPTMEEALAAYETKIQARLDDFARTLTYDGIMSACTYATSGVEMYRIEGQYCVDARDATWAKAFELLNSFDPAQGIPSWEEIEAQLPVLAWPEGSRGWQG